MLKNRNIIKLFQYNLFNEFIYQRHPVLVSVLPDHFTIRNFAKGKNKLKDDKGKQKKKNIQISESFLAEVINVDKLKSELDSAMSKMKETYVTQISLRSTTGSIENLPINFESQKHTLIELGHIIRKNPKTIVINMVAFPQAIPSVMKAITDSGMNLNPQQDGTSIFIPVPKVTKEYREALAKNAKTHFIKCRDNIRNIQTKYIKIAKTKEKDGLSEDTTHQISEQVTFLGDLYVSQAEKIWEQKQTELIGES